MGKGTPDDASEGDQSALDPQRRELLRVALAGSVFGSLGLNPLAGGAQSGPVGTGSDLVFADGFEPQSAPPGSDPADVTSIRVSSPEPGALPVTVGHWFAKGDLPAGSVLGGAGIPLQVEVRNLWPDGSVRFAAVTSVAPAGTYTLRRGGMVATGPTVAEPAIDAVVSFTNVRDHLGAVLHASLTASLATARAAGPSAWNRATPRRLRQALGPLMSEFHYYSPTAHPHLAVWWYVRAYRDGRVEVTTRIENGWLNVAGPGEWVYHVDVSVGGTSRYVATNIGHRHHTAWSRVDWIGGNPNVTPRHDTRYLMRTRMIPTLGVRSLAASVYDSYASTAEQAERGTPFDLAMVNPGLGGGGHSDNYGVIPGWDAAHSIEAEPRLYWTVMRNARYASGRFHVHYRDENTGMPARGSTHYDLRINNANSGIHDNSGGMPATPAPAGGLNSPGWFFSHGPALNYYAYGLSARWEFWEEAAFFSTTADLWQNNLNQYNGYRIGWWGMQLRQRAHIFRLRAQCAVMAPRTFGGLAVTGADLDQVIEAEGRLNAEIDYYRQAYVAGGNVTEPRLVAMRDNRLGVWQSATDADGAVDGRLTAAGLQQAINCLHTLWAYDVEASTNPNFLPLVEFTARWPLGLMGALPDAQNWDWRFCTAYTIKIGSIDGPTAADARTAASWNAVWADLNANYAWQQMGGGAAVPPPAAVPLDNRVYTLQTRDGQNVGWHQPVLQLDNLADNFTATFHHVAVLGIIHSITNSARMDSLARASEWAAGRMYESATYRASLAPGSFMRASPTYVQWATASRTYENLDDANSLLNLIEAAKAARTPGTWSWVQSTLGTFQDAWVPMGLRDPFNAVDGVSIQRMITDWGGWAYDHRRMRFVLQGPGHSAGANTEIYTWSLGSRRWGIAYYGAEMVACPSPFARPKVGYNDTPQSPHAYDNQAFGLRSGLMYAGMAGTFNSGFRARVWDVNVPGDQPIGPDGVRGLRYTGMWALDMTKAGRGLVVGATGSNPASGAFAGTVLTGALAWKHFDWYAPNAPNRPNFLGLDMGFGIEGTIVATDSVPGRDAIFGRSGNGWVWRTTIPNDSTTADTHELVGRDGGIFGGGQRSVQMAEDPVRGLLVAISGTVNANPGFVYFMDLKRPWGASNGWRAATLTGPALSEFIAMERRECGCDYSPWANGVLVYNGLGRQVWLITAPAAVGGITPDTGWVLTKLPMDATSAAPPTTPHPYQLPDIGVNGKFQRVRRIGHAYVEDPIAGRVWWLIPGNHADPRGI